VTLEADDLEELTGEIRRIIESNKDFLKRLNDDEYEDDDGDGDGADPAADLDDYEEL
jgi:cell pole-organizing protein PopZ